MIIQQSYLLLFLIILEVHTVELIVIWEIHLLLLDIQIYQVQKKQQ